MNTALAQCSSSPDQVPYPGCVTPAAPTMHSNEQIYARAAQTMQRGKMLVIGGFAIAVAGMLAYCSGGLAGIQGQALAAAAPLTTHWLSVAGLAGLGVGTLLWLIGSFLYSLGALDSDPAGPDLYF